MKNWILETHIIESDTNTISYDKHGAGDAFIHGRKDT